MCIRDRDYIVVKMPKWPFDKFADASRALGTQMKATGELMAIAPSFEMALLKAVRGAEIGMDTLNRKPDHGDDAPIPVSYTHLDVYKRHGGDPRQLAGICGTL